MAEATIPFDVLNRWTGEVQFTATIACSEDALPAVKLGLAVRWAHANRASLDGARLDGASLVGARLDGASLVGAIIPDETLRSFKADMWLTLSQSNPLHVQHLIQLLKAGNVDGSTYGDGRGCACLVGSLAHAEGKSGTALDHNSGRPAERWFMMIKPGNLPGAKTGGGFAAGKALEWADGWCAAHGVPTEPDVQAVAKPKRAKRVS